MAITTMEVWKELMLECSFPPVFSCQNIDEHLFCHEKHVFFSNFWSKYRQTHFPTWKNTWNSFKQGIA